MHTERVEKEVLHPCMFYQEQLLFLFLVYQDRRRHDTEKPSVFLIRVFTVTGNSGHTVFFVFVLNDEL